MCVIKHGLLIPGNSVDYETFLCQISVAEIKFQEELLHSISIDRQVENR